MHYDPIKKIFGTVARQSTLFRRAFYGMLDLMFLRAWYVRRALRQLLDGRAQGFRLFDAGSGFGQYSYYIATRYRNARIHAVDVKEEHPGVPPSMVKSAGCASSKFVSPRTHLIQHTKLAARTLRRHDDAMIRLSLFRERSGLVTQGR